MRTPPELSEAEWSVIQSALHFLLFELDRDRRLGRIHPGRLQAHGQALRDVSRILGLLADAGVPLPSPAARVGRH